MWLMALCCVGMLSALLMGKTIRAPLLSLALTDTTSFEVFSELHLMDMRTGLVVKTADQPVRCCPVWSPDGGRIAFIGPNRQPFIWDIRDGTTRPFQSPQDETRNVIVGWLPDGESLLMLAFHDATADFYQVRPDADRFEQIAVLDIRVSFYGSVSWSPGSPFWVFSGLDTKGLHIYRFNTDDSTLQQLTTNGNDFDARLSPDGSRIIFTSVRSESYKIYSMAVDGSDQQRLTQNAIIESAPLWSPDGSHLLFQTYASYNASRLLNVMNADGSAQHQVADQISLYALPSWSPDGEQILYEVQRPNLRVELYAVDADGGHNRLLIGDDFTLSLYAAWQPQP
jgi:Tol biopolymer transport system component